MQAIFPSDEFRIPGQESELGNLPVDHTGSSHNLLTNISIALTQDSTQAQDKIMVTMVHIELK